MGFQNEEYNAEDLRQAAEELFQIDGPEGILKIREKLASYQVRPFN